MRKIQYWILAVIMLILLTCYAVANPTRITPICINSADKLLQERNPRPTPVFVVTGNVVHQVEGFTRLIQTKRLSGNHIAWERASIAIQIAIARNPFNDPGDLVDYISGAAVTVDTPNVLPLRAVPRITLVEAVNRYLRATTEGDRVLYGDLLFTVEQNRFNACGFAWTR